MDQAESTTHPGGLSTLLLLLFPLHSSLMRPLPDGVLFMLLDSMCNSSLKQSYAEARFKTWNRSSLARVAPRHLCLPSLTLPRTASVVPSSADQLYLLKRRWGQVCQESRVHVRMYV